MFKLRKKREQEKEEAEDWNFNFDFSVYDQEDDTEEITETIFKKERPQVTGLKSRFSNGEAELERLANLNTEISKLSIKVSARTNELKELWSYYGVLEEFWESIRNIFGSAINKEMSILIRKCLRMLEESQKQGKPVPKIHHYLLFLRSNLYRLKQYSNLGIELERMRRSGFQKAKRQIEQ